MEKAVRAILAEQGVQVIKESSSGELIARCPFPDHDDRHASFAVNKHTGLYHCFGCERKGGIERLYAELNGMNIWQAMGEMKRKYDLSVDLVMRQAFPKEFDVLEEVPTNQALQGVYNLLPKGSAAPEEYTRRGLTQWDWEMWGGRIDGDMMVFPVWSLGGKMVALVGRALDPGSGQRYISYEGSKTKDTLYCANSCYFCNEIVVCEGLLDTHRVQAVVGNSVDVCGLLSTGMSKKQEALLGYWPIISLWLDNDDPGEKAAVKYAKMLISRGHHVNIVPYYSDAKDQATPGFTEKCLRESFENRRPYISRRVYFPIEIY